MDLYEIVVKGHINERIAWWFGDAVATQLPSGETSLVGPVADQAALYGIITGLRDLGLALVMVRKVEAVNMPMGLDRTAK